MEQIMARSVKDCFIMLFDVWIFDAFYKKVGETIFDI